MGSAEGPVAIEVEWTCPEWTAAGFAFALQCTVP